MVRVKITKDNGGDQIAPLVTMAVWRRLSTHERRRVVLRRGHGDGPYVQWSNSGCRGSWILTRALTPV